MKRTIAIDIDDVLSLFAEAFVNYSNKFWDSGLSIEDYRWVEAYFDR